MFSDVDMPGGLDGLRLAELVRNRWPPIKIIITSGHLDLTNLVAHYIEKVLPKPYSPEKVVAAIRELVEQR
jgi:CheY-like chemotaxis protein